MDIGAAIVALLGGAALAGYAYRIELARLDFWLLQKLRSTIKATMEPYRYKSRHAFRADEKFYTYKKVGKDAYAKKVVFG